MPLIILIKLISLPPPRETRTLQFKDAAQRVEWLQSPPWSVWPSCIALVAPPGLAGGRTLTK